MELENYIKTLKEKNKEITSTEETLDTSIAYIDGFSKGLMFALKHTDCLFSKKETTWQERFYNEYWENKNRYNKLHRMIVKYEAGTLEFKPNCPIEILKEQASYVGNYLHILEVRAEIEKVDLFKEEK